MSETEKDKQNSTKDEEMLFASIEEEKDSEENEKNISISELELHSIKEEAKEFKNKYLRALAESENMRKRLQKEREELIQYALENIINEFLNPIDHLENALSYTENMSDDVKNWAVGFKMILQQFKDVLDANGVTPMNTNGKPFDPHYHEAIELIPTADYPHGTIIEECLRGYSIGDRTLRPAKVKVAAKPNSSNVIEESEEEDSQNQKKKENNNDE